MKGFVYIFGVLACPQTAFLKPLEHLELYIYKNALFNFDLFNLTFSFISDELNLRIVKATKKLCIKKSLSVNFTPGGRNTYKWLGTICWVDEGIL